MTTARTYKLFEVVTNASVADSWEAARTEWSVTRLTEEEDEVCICGKAHIVQCYTIENHQNFTMAGWIGVREEILQ